MIIESITFLLTHCDLVDVVMGLFIIGSGNGLLLDGTKQLPEPMLIIANWTIRNK